jgi:hypothetical protein
LHKWRTDTPGRLRYGLGVLRLTAMMACGLVLLVSVRVAGDDDPSFRRTTPRGSFGRDGPALLVGVPGGRAWGIESELIPAPRGPAAFRATVDVIDPAVREAFVRIAWYDRATGRPRQFALSDAQLIREGESTTVEVALDPPPGAVAYRVRVLARLRAADALSARDAVRASLSAPRARTSTFPATRLLP